MKIKPKFGASPDGLVYNCSDFLFLLLYLFLKTKSEIFLNIFIDKNINKSNFLFKTFFNHH